MDITLHQHGDEKFVAVPNGVAQDLTLSIEALGAYTRMRSYSNKFKFKTKWLQSSWQLGRDKLQKILKELKQHNLLEVVPARDSHGHYAGQAWHVYKYPKV